ncbi:glycoside hydrolase family 113 [Haliangium sp.]|uniref:glycoside hydrolase family 113 n=1 Tax=Haliangium sp. TaxID=2663208 RepID=UPI003D15051C
MASPPAGAPPVRGMALGLWPDGSRAPARFDPAIDEIAALGATHIALVTTWSQTDVRASELGPGPRTIDAPTLRHAIAHARRRGLEVLLFPILTLDRTGPGEWRGTLAPADVGRWWLAYEGFILHYAAVAAETGAEALLIGSELGSTEAWRDRWYHLISRVERVYSGRLVYSANWDHYQHVSFWRRLDVIGVTGYFELGRAGATEAALVDSWTPVRDALVGFAAAQDKPLWITEVGYVSVTGTTARPWDYGLDGAVDLDEQRRAYAAFVRAWHRVPTLGGVFFWIWDGPGGAGDRGYTPRGKPAEAVLRGWFRSAGSGSPRP